MIKGVLTTDPNQPGGNRRLSHCSLIFGATTDRFSYLHCIGQPPLDRSHQFIEVWDEDFIPVEATLADSFVELGLDLGRLLRPGIEFSGLYIRTPEDVVLTSFRGMGSWAESGIALR